MDKNPTSCETYERILNSRRVLRLARKNGHKWSIALMERINAVHTGHDNFDLHNH